MDVKTLTRRPDVIKQVFTTLPDESVIANKTISLCFPKRFEEAGLAEVYESIRCIGMVGVISGDSFASIASLGQFEFTPGDVVENRIEGETYVWMTFEKGEQVIRSLHIPVDALLTYDYMNEFTKYGRIPWYLDYEHVLSVIDESAYVTGSRTGDTAQAVRVLYSITCRDPTNPDVAFRYGKGLEDPTVKPLVIGMNNPSQLLTGTFARFSGGYLADNTIAGLQEDASEMTAIESILRGVPDA